MAATQAQRVRPAYEGWNTEAAPEYLGEAQAPLVENLLCRTGKLVMRGPIHHLSSSLGFPAGSRVHGIMYVNGQLLVNTDTGNAAYAAAVPGGVTVSASVPFTSGNTRPKGRSMRLLSYSWCKGTSGRLLRWDGTAVEPTSFTEPNAPNNFADLDLFAERLFVAGGTVNGTGAANTLLFSDAGGPVAGTVADWTDNASGLINQIVVGGPEAIVALRAVGRDLVVLKRTSAWVLSGSGASSFSVRQISGSYGCLDAFSVVAVDDALYWLSDSGYVRWDGAQTVVVSRAIEDDLTRAAARVLSGGATYRAAAALLRGDVILLSVSNMGDTGSGTPEAYFQALYDTNRGTWTKFSHAVNALPIAALQRLDDINHTLASDGANLFYVSDLGISEVRQGSLARELKDTISGVTAAIPAKWHSRLVRLGSPTLASQLHRILIDYRADNGDAAPAWNVTVLRGDGTTAVATYALPGEALGSPTYLYRRRASNDAFAEAVDVQVRIEWAGETDAVQAELYDVTVEYQSTHQRSSS